MDGWLHTGDVGYVDSEGFLYFAGRESNVIVSGGLTIFPAEIERVLQHASGGRQRWRCSVCPTRSGARPPARSIRPAPDTVVDERELIEYCSQRLASYKKPTSVLRRRSDPARRRRRAF